MNLEDVLNGLHDWHAGFRAVVEAALAAVERLEPDEVAAARARLAAEDLDDREATAAALEPTCDAAPEGSIARGVRWMTWGALVHEWEGTPAVWSTLNWAEELYARGAGVPEDAARARLAEIAHSSQ